MAAITERISHILWKMIPSFFKDEDQVKKVPHCNTFHSDLELAVKEFLSHMNKDSILNIGTIVYLGGAEIKSQGRHASALVANTLNRHNQLPNETLLAVLKSLNMICASDLATNKNLYEETHLLENIFNIIVDKDRPMLIAKWAIHVLYCVLLGSERPSIDYQRQLVGILDKFYHQDWSDFKHNYASKCIDFLNRPLVSLSRNPQLRFLNNL